MYIRGIPTFHSYMTPLCCPIVTGNQTSQVSYMFTPFAFATCCIKIGQPQLYFVVFFAAFYALSNISNSVHVSLFTFHNWSQYQKPQNTQMQSWNHVYNGTGGASHIFWPGKSNYNLFSFDNLGYLFLRWKIK